MAAPDDIWEVMDMDILKLQSKILYEAGKKLYNKQKKIRTKPKHKRLTERKDKFSLLSMDFKDALTTCWDVIRDLPIPEKMERRNRTRSSLQPAPKRSRGHRSGSERHSRDDSSRLSDVCKTCQEKQFELFKLQKELNDMTNKYEHEKREKSEAQSRFTEMASSKLRDNNPNITDLSDLNRPTKISERFAEFYDNEWTEAYGVLEKEMKGERNVIDSLLKILMDVYEQCKDLNRGFMERAKSCIDYPAKTDVGLSGEMRQKLKEIRKLRAPMNYKQIAEHLKDKVAVPRCDERAMKAYFTECVAVCWLSVVQDPPLVMDATLRDKFDKDCFKDFTKRGPFTDYVVWPALFLHENGPLLGKGVAQGCASQITRSDSFRARQAIKQSADYRRSTSHPGPRRDRRERPIVSDDTFTQHGGQSTNF